MRIGKLWLVTILGAIPAVGHAQVNIGVGVNVNIDANAYDSTAPGDPVQSVDVFYDQLSPYGVWVDDPDAGRVFIPQQDAYVPYTSGHWEYTRLGFVWVSSEPFGWATSHYGRWAYSNNYGRWIWAPDTEWGPAWVSWRQTDSDFGWAPLPPARMSYTPPPESWHYCGAAHILDPNVNRYYEPRERVIAIHREARPIEHYQTVSNVKVIVGPPPSMLRDHRVEARPVQIEQKAIGRWSAPEAHAQVQRAQEHRATFEQENQHRVEAQPHINTAQQHVIETHPQLKVQAEARFKAAPQPQHAEPNRGEPHAQPAAPHMEPNRGEAHAQPAAPHAEPNRGEAHAQPAAPHAEPNRGEAHAQPAAPHAEPNHGEAHAQPAPHIAPTREPAQHAAPAPQPHIAPTREPAQPHAEPNRGEAHAQPAPKPQPAPAPRAAPPAPHHEEKK